MIAEPGKSFSQRQRAAEDKGDNDHQGDSIHAHLTGSKQHNRDGQEG